MTTTVRIFIIGALASLALATPAVAAPKVSPTGIAVGNVLVGDYGSKGKVTAAFDPDGTVAMTFPMAPSGARHGSPTRTIFCMIMVPGADGKMGYSCERNLIAGKKLGETWQQVDSEGETATISVQPRPK